MVVDPSWRSAEDVHRDLNIPQWRRMLSKIYIVIWSHSVTFVKLPIVRLLCRLGLHRFPRWQPDGTDTMFVLLDCVYCDEGKSIARNFPDPENLW